MQPMISVIVPVYNVEAWLETCLRSLAAQTASDVEFLLVDDGSTDRSPAICQRYAAADSRFVLLRRENGGVSAARNLGLRHAKGRYIGFADSDDWLEPTLYERLLTALQENDADAAMCGYYEYLPEEGAAPMTKGCEPAAPCGPQEAVRQILRRTGYFTALWNKLFARAVVFPHGEPMLFDETLAVGEDETWLLRVLPGVRSACFLPEPLYHWRSRTGSASRSGRITPRSMSVLRAKQEAVKLVSAFAPQLKGLARSRLLNDCYHLKVNAYRAGDRAALRTVHQAFRQVRVSWLISKDVPLLRKGKVLAMDAMMALHASPALVDRVDGLRRQHG